MRRLLGIFVLLFAATLGASSAQAPAQRIALVIGNANYQVPAWKLANPVRDAELMSQRLTALGFSVDLVRDATRAQMDAAFQRYGTRLQVAGRNAVSVVFYAGHGAENDGANYLVPTDANIRTKDQLRYQAPPAQFLLDYMARAGNAVNILILDACRDMPLPDGNRSLGRGGLAEIPERPNVLIAYSTAPNTTAPDGSGLNSPFTAALAAALASAPNDPVSLLFEDVQTRVYAQSAGAQRPRFTNGLGVARWSFANARPQQAAATPAPAQVASAARTTTPAPPRTASYSPGQTIKDCADCPELVVIPGGTFTMGSSASEAGRYANGDPQHAVNVPSFAAGKYEVTFDEWMACANSGGCSGYVPDDRAWGKGNLPVINVSWSDAKQYVQWLSGKTGKTYRLLTEAEWEYAARAGTGTPFWWGASITSNQANYDGNYILTGGVGGVNRQKTIGVGSFQANLFGLYDVHGNVWEWVEDCNHDTYAGAPPDGSAWISGDCSLRVVRGGSWYTIPQMLRSAFRGRSAPSSRNGDLGFRVARTL